MNSLAYNVQHIAVHELIFVYSFLLDRVLVSSVPCATLSTLKPKKPKKALKPKKPKHFFKKTLGVYQPWLPIML